MHDTTAQPHGERPRARSHRTPCARSAGTTGAYWFFPGRRRLPARPGALAEVDRFRGIATGDRRPPKGYRRTDFRVPTLREVLAPSRTPRSTSRSRGRPPKATDASNIRNAEVAGRACCGASMRTDASSSVSFHEKAVDRFHALAPTYPLAPGLSTARRRWILAGSQPGPGWWTPSSSRSRSRPAARLDCHDARQRTSPARHREGYAWHVWLSVRRGRAPQAWRNLIDWCVDGVMTAQPVRCSEKVAAGRAPPPAACG
jgi:glycerophosphoryl diester phosphodiesterase